MSREQWLSGCPVLSPENTQVLEVWRFCEGWKPETLPLAVAFFDVPDVDFLIEQLLVVRRTMEARKPKP